jgi:hypothetical protein
MPTYIKAGLYKRPFVKDDDELEVPEVYIDAEVFQVIDDEEELIVQITYEELRGIMAIMAAEQEKRYLYIKARADKN